PTPTATRTSAPKTLPFPLTRATSPALVSVGGRHRQHPWATSISPPCRHHDERDAPGGGRLRRGRDPAPMVRPLLRATARRWGRHQRCADGSPRPHGPEPLWPPGRWWLVGANGRRSNLDRRLFSAVDGRWWLIAAGTPAASVTD